jgi:hypothetical protein
MLAGFDYLKSAFATYDLLLFVQNCLLLLLAFSFFPHPFQGMLSCMG